MDRVRTEVEKERDRMDGRNRKRTEAKQEFQPSEDKNIIVHKKII
jgi:hypothetical protein